MRITRVEIKLVRSLGQKKFRDREKKFIVEGWKSLRDALDSDFRIDLVAISGGHRGDPDHESLLVDLKSRGLMLKEMTDLELRQLTDTVHAQGVIAVVQQKTRSIDEILRLQPTLLVLADRVADPGNAGTIVRTCDWFGVDALILNEGCVDLYNEKVVRSTSGSIFRLPFVEHVDLVALVTRLKASGFKCFATAGDARTSYTKSRYGEKNAVILGNEAVGVDSEIRKLADDVIGIPREGKAESLNVGVACGILLAHLRHGR